MALGKEFSVVNARFVKPLDTLLLDSLSGDIVTIEDNVALGGFGSLVTGYMAANHKKNTVKVFAYRDEFIRHGAISELQSEYGVNTQEIQAYILGKLV